MNAAPSFGVSVDIKCLLILLILTLERTFQEKKKLRYLFDVSLCFWFIQKFPFRGHCRCQTRGQWGWIDNCGGHWTDGFEAVVGDWRTTNDAGLRSWTMDAWWCWDRVRGCQKLWGCILKNKYKFIFYKFYYVKSRSKENKPYDFYRNQKRSALSKKEQPNITGKKPQKIKLIKYKWLLGQ